ncbi:hypothetical protein BC829DRAFT_185465 [Chytridium lagenaria]|nr:hypothetical protein BC829DRAFT_185465 [Chytridium lagenaria]
MGDDDVDIPDAFPASGTFHFEHHRHHHGKENSASRRVNETSDMTRVMMDSWGSKSWRTGSRGGLGDEDGEQGGSSRDLMRDLEALSLDPIEMPVELDAGSPLRPPMFSAERHYARAQERERTAPARHEEQYESWASESLQLETLLTENTDDVLMEARQLLKNWVDNDAVPSYDVSSRITTKEKPRTIEELFLVPSSRQEEIRDIVSTVVSQSQVSSI